MPARSRTAAVVLSIICFTTSYALTPSEVRSRTAHRLPTVTIALAADTPLPLLTPVGDPFAPRVHPASTAAMTTARPADAAALARLAPLPPNAGARFMPFVLASPGSAMRVSAIVLGARPLALLSTGGSPRIVRVGDVVDGSRVRTIDARGIVLTDGRHVSLVAGSS